MALVDVTIIQDASFILSRRDSNTPLVISQENNVYREEHSLSLRKTSYPVETGASLTDHAFKQPDIITIEGGVMDLNVVRRDPRPVDQTPLGEFNLQTTGYVSVTSYHNEGAARAAWAEIYQIFQDRALVSLTTTLGRYDNMIITSAVVPRDSTTGLDLKFTLVLEEVLVEPIDAQIIPVSGVASRDSLSIQDVFTTGFDIFRSDPIPSELSAELSAERVRVLMNLSEAVEQAEPNIGLPNDLRNVGLRRFTDVNGSYKVIKLKTQSETRANVTYSATLVYVDDAPGNITGWVLDTNPTLSDRGKYDQRLAFDYRYTQPLTPMNLYPLVANEDISVTELAAQSAVPVDLAAPGSVLFFARTPADIRTTGYLIVLPIELDVGRAGPPL